MNNPHKILQWHLDTFSFSSTPVYLSLLLDVHPYHREAQTCCFGSCGWPICADTFKSKRISTYRSSCKYGALVSCQRAAPVLYISMRCRAVTGRHCILHKVALCANVAPCHQELEGVQRATSCYWNAPKYQCKGSASLNASIARILSSFSSMLLQGSNRSSALEPWVFYGWLPRTSDFQHITTLVPAVSNSAFKSVLDILIFAMSVPDIKMFRLGNIQHIHSR